MPRIPLVTGENLTPAQQRVYDAMLSGPRKSAPVGPLAVAMHRPELAEAWSALGLVLVLLQLSATTARIHHPADRPVLGLPVRVGVARG